MGYRTIRFTFTPFGYLQGSDVSHFADVLHEQGVVGRFNLQAHRRRGAWGSTLPVGIFDNDYRENACTWDQHIASRDRITTALRDGLPHNRRPIPLGFDVLERDGALYYHPEALRAYATVADAAPFLRALARFLEAAVKDPSLIIPKSSAPYVPPEQRGTDRGGRLLRGPDWTPDEDQVLRQWFGQRTVGEHAGHHVKLTEQEWQVVLSNLPRRNRNGVRNRLVELNAKLKREYFRDGYVSQHRIAEYMSKVLGERPRIPLRDARSRRAVVARSR